MNRREFLRRTTKTSLALGITTPLQAHAEPAVPAPSEAPRTLPGTSPLTMEGDLAAQMVDGIHRFLLRKTQEVAETRPLLWKRDYRSLEAYNQSVSPNRERFRQIIGAVGPRAQAKPPQLLESFGSPALISSAANYQIYALRWSVLGAATSDWGEELSAEGLLLEPQGPPVARVVAIPEADWTPEMLTGLSSGVPTAAQFARRLAESGCQVIVPVLIDRADTFSGDSQIGFTNQPHREWIYRMSFEVGRHVIGYEVQKILAAVDWFEQENAARPAAIGVMGYGEGGLLALYSAALDSRIAATVVSGYFQAREGLWKEPIYRDVWGLVREFGDAELAGLIVPRALVIEASRGPEVSGPPPATAVHKGVACPNGKIVSPPLDSVKKEVERAGAFYAGLKEQDKLQLVVDKGGEGPPGSAETLRLFLRSLDPDAKLEALGEAPVDARGDFDPQPRLHRQLTGMMNFTHALVRRSFDQRKAFWAKANAARPVKKYYEPPSGSGSAQWSDTIEHWNRATLPYREYVWEEVIGRLPAPSVTARPRTRLVYDEPQFRGYEVVLDVWPDVFAYGILLVPKNIKAGERRPVVVCQHGLEGRPSEVADPSVHSHYYHQFGVRLAEEGFVTYAPQNPYIGGDHFRMIQRMGHPLKLAMFSFIIGQHQRTLDWLAEQPFVDPDRMGFYGLSYGGKTALRVPPFVERYALSVCSGDFNSWIWKTTSVHSHYSYMFTKEYDIYEFNLANVADHAESAGLIAPRPFMVERGHYDPVAPDDRVAYEYAKVRWFYAYMGIPDRTAIEFFDGPHTIHGVGTFQFLHRHLRWR